MNKSAAGFEVLLILVLDFNSKAIIVLCLHQNDF